MDKLFGVDWAEAFIPSVSLLEIFLRGTLMYLVLFALLRLVLKRQAGTVGITDLLVLVLIADAAQNAMSANYTSITEGVLLVATIIFWSYALDWLGYRCPFLQRLVHPPPLPLVRDGQMLRRNMRRELITEEELLAEVRAQGYEDLSQVKQANMEGNGRISVIGIEPQHAQDAGRREGL